MRHATPMTEPLDALDDDAVIGAGFEIAAIMASMTIAASVCSGIITLALIA